MDIVQARRKLLAAMLAMWALPEDVLEQYLVLKKPMIQDTGADVVVGRAILPKILTEQSQKGVHKKVGAHASRGGCVSNWVSDVVP